MRRTLCNIELILLDALPDVSPLCHYHGRNMIVSDTSSSSNLRTDKKIRGSWKTGRMAATRTWNMKEKKFIMKGHRIEENEGSYNYGMYSTDRCTTMNLFTQQGSSNKKRYDKYVDRLACGTESAIPRSITNILTTIGLISYNFPMWLNFVYGLLITRNRCEEESLACKKIFLHAYRVTSFSS